MSRSTIQVFIDELASQLQRSVVVDDPSVQVWYTSPHYGDEDELRRRAVLQRDAGEAAIGYVLAQGVTRWTSAGVIPPNPELGLLHARVCVPIRQRGTILGFLMVVDKDASLTTAELSLLVRAADEVAALLLAENPPALDEGAQALSEALEDLVSDEGSLRREAIRTLAGNLGKADQHVRAIRLEAYDLGVGVAPGHAYGALTHALSVAASQPASWKVLHAAADDAATVVVTSPGPVTEAAARSFAVGLVARVHAVASGRFRAVAGIGTDGIGLDHARASFRQALLAARAGRAQLPGEVHAWEELGELSLLLQLPVERLDESTLPPEVQRLLAHDKDGRSVETVLAYLDHAGSAPSTADALHLHRTTLYHRLERIREATGLDLDDGRTRLALHVGLRLMQVLDRDRA